MLEQGGLSRAFHWWRAGEFRRLGAPRKENPFFVIEADEYDTAFSTKRSKFVHYRARTAILNNLEYDHADMFHNLAAIQQQLHHFVRIVPPSGLIVANVTDPALTETLAMGCWTPVERFNDSQGWSARCARSRRQPLRSVVGRNAARQSVVETCGLSIICTTRSRPSPPPATPACRRRRRSRRWRRFATSSANRGTRRGEQRHGVRRLCAPPDRDQRDAGGVARARRQRATSSRCWNHARNTMKLGVHRDTLRPRAGRR